MRSWIVDIISRYRWPLTLLVILQLGCGVLMALQPRYYQQLVSLAINYQHANLWATGLPLITLFRGNRPFLLTSFPEIRAFGGEIVPVQKKFPQKVAHNLLILLTLLP